MMSDFGIRAEGVEFRGFRASTTQTNESYRLLGFRVPNWRFLGLQVGPTTHGMHL